jgi:hypothetical protein
MDSGRKALLLRAVAGEYRLRISPQQLQRLSLTDTGTRELSVSGDGSFISGIDLMVLPFSPAASAQIAP